MSSVHNHHAELIKTGRILPQFDDTPVAMRTALLIPVLFALAAGWEGHSIFQAILQWSPALYSRVEHVGFLAMVVAPLVALFLLRADLPTKRNVGFVLTGCYAAVLTLAQLAHSYIVVTR